MAERRDDRAERIANDTQTLCQVALSVSTVS